MYTHQYNYRRRRFGRAKKPSPATRACCYCARYFFFGAGVTILCSYLLFGSLVGHVVKNYDSQVTVLTIRTRNGDKDDSSFYQTNNEHAQPTKRHDDNSSSSTTGTTTTTLTTIGLNEIGRILQRALNGDLHELGHLVSLELEALADHLKAKAISEKNRIVNYASIDNSRSENVRGDETSPETSSEHPATAAGMKGNIQNLLSHAKQSLGDNLAQGISQLHAVSNDLRENTQHLAGGLHEFGENMQEYDTPHGSSEPHVKRVAVNWSALSDLELRNHLTATGTEVQKGKIQDSTIDKDDSNGKKSHPHNLHDEPIEFYWQMPSANDKNSNNLRGSSLARRQQQQQRPQAILFLAHQCRLTAVDWFSTLSHRAPEEQGIVQVSRQRGAMVVAMSSSNHNGKCWDEYDASRFAKLLRYVDERQSSLFGKGGRRIPIFVFGSEIGAKVLTPYLPRAFGKNLVSHSREESGKQHRKLASAPNMPVDGLIVENVESLVNPTIPVVYLTQANEKHEEEAHTTAPPKQTEMAHHIALPPVALTATLLHERLPELVCKDQSRRFFNLVMQEKDLVVHQNGNHFVHNPMHDPTMMRIIREFVEQISQQGDDKHKIARTIDSEDMIQAIVEVLMVVWGSDATTRDGVDQGLEWLMKRVKKHAL